MKIEKIGSIHCGEDGFVLALDPPYRAALAGLEGFSHVQILYWFDGCDTPEARKKRVEHKPYRRGPETLGTFATRSPERPNPIALSAAQVTYVDAAGGMLGLAYIDADDGSPVLDVKPYTPSLDRVEAPRVPDWCADWPASVEKSGAFDWAQVFNF